MRALSLALMLCGGFLIGYAVPDITPKPVVVHHAADCTRIETGERR